jgi:hypothetical protein
VTIEEARPGYRATKEQLESMGLFAPEEVRSVLPPRCSDEKERRDWPDYARCLGESIARGKKRTSADYTFCCIALDIYRKTPEATADKLVDLSTKAQENGYLYAVGQATRAAGEGGAESETTVLRLAVYKPINTAPQPLNPHSAMSCVVSDRSLVAQRFPVLGFGDDVVGLTAEAFVVFFFPAVCGRLLSDESNAGIVTTREYGHDEFSPFSFTWRGGN